MMTYDDERGQVLMFGGAGQDRSYGDLWALGDSGWSKLSETGPPERDAGVFVYDSTRKRAVLYGGRNSTGELHDTWEWDGTRWHEVADSGPTASVHAAASSSMTLWIVCASHSPSSRTISPSARKRTRCATAAARASCVTITIVCP